MRIPCKEKALHLYSLVVHLSTSLSQLSFLSFFCSLLVTKQSFVSRRLQLCCTAVRKFVGICVSNTGGLHQREIERVPVRYHVIDIEKDEL